MGIIPSQKLDVLERLAADHPIVALGGYSSRNISPLLAERGVRGYLPLTTDANNYTAAWGSIVAGGTFFDTEGQQGIYQHIATGKRGLTRRERETLDHLANGLTSHQIAEAMETSVRTTESHFEHILEKLRIKGKEMLMTYAFLFAR